MRRFSALTAVALLAPATSTRLVAQAPDSSSSVQSAALPSAPSVAATRLTGGIQLDGVLEEAAWAEESGASRLHREALRGPDARHTGLTRGFSGRLARGIRNRLMEELNREGTDVLPYPLQRGLVRNLSTAAEAAGRADLLPLWAGQSASLSTCTDAVTFLGLLVDEVADVAGPIAEWNARHRQKPLSIAAHS